MKCLRLLPLFFVLLLSPLTASAITCYSALLPVDYFQLQPNGKISFGITGNARAYSQEYTLKNMGLTEAEIMSMQGRVLLLGEGFGTLLPLFAQAPKIQLTAVDPIYGVDPIPPGFMGERLRWAKESFAPYLDASSSHALPFEDSSVDAIYSHMLINNLTEKIPNTDKYRYSPIATATLIESIRVLKKGAKATFAMFTTAKDTKNLMESVANLLREAYPSHQYTMITFKHWTDYKTFPELAPDLQSKPAEDITITRLIIQKIK